MEEDHRVGSRRHPGEVARSRAIVRGRGDVEQRMTVVVGERMSLGEQLAFDLAVIAEQDILGDRFVRPRRKTRRAADVITEATSLGVGDFVVHAKLFWAGRQQDLARFSTKVFYAPKER